MSRRSALRARLLLARLQIQGITRVTDDAGTPCEATSANLNWVFGAIGEAQAFRWPMLGKERDRKWTQQPKLQVLFGPRGVDVPTVGSGNLKGELAGTVEIDGMPEGVLWNAAGRPLVVSKLLEDSRFQLMTGVAISDRRTFLSEGNDGEEPALLRIHLRGSHILRIESLTVRSFPRASQIQAASMNWRGAVSGIDTDDNANSHPFVWMPDSREPIRLSSYARGLESHPLAISDGEDAVGWSEAPKDLWQRVRSVFDSRVLDNFNSQAVIWPGSHFSVLPEVINRRPFIHPTCLGTLGGDESEAKASAGWGRFVVGQSETEGGDFHAFLAVDGVMVDLNELPNMSKHWVLKDAISVMAVDEGPSPLLVIVGNGEFLSEPAAYCLTVVARSRG